MKPIKITLELMMITSVMWFMLVLAQIVSKGCHNSDSQITGLFITCGVLSYYFWRGLE